MEIKTSNEIYKTCKYPNEKWISIESLEEYFIENNYPFWDEIIADLNKNR